MPKSAMFELAILLLGLCFGPFVHAEADEASPLAPSYRVTHGWPELPEGEYLGSVSGVDVDSHGRVFVFHRANRRWPTDDKLDLKPIERPTVAVFDERTGKLLKYSAKGEFLFQWGTSGPGPGQFNLVHGVVLGADGRVYVSDRSNGRIHIFGADGHFLKQWASRLMGRPYAVALGTHGLVFVADGGDQPDTPPDRSALVVLGSDGTPLARIGRWGNQDGQMEMAHAVAVGQDAAVYIGDISGCRIQKFVPVR